MIWAFVGFGVFVIGIVSFGAFLILQSVSQTLSNALSTLERVHSNDGKRIDTVLDRLMAMDFESFKQYQLVEEADEGGIEEPEEEPYVRLEIPGYTKALGDEDLQRAAAERRILEEDFPEEAELPA